MDEQRQETVIVRRDVIRGFDCMGFFCWWWLRSPGNNQNNAANVNNDGDVNENGNNVNNSNNAVRPALLSYGLKPRCAFTRSVPRAKESDSLPIFGKTYVGGVSNANCFTNFGTYNVCTAL